MAGLTKVAGTLSGRLLAVAAAGGLLAAMTAAPVPARAAAGHHALRVSAVRAVTGSRPRLARRPRVVSYRPVHVSWPAAASGSIRLAGAPVPLTRAGRAGSRAASPGGGAWAAGTPVWAQPVTPPGRGVRGVRVRVLGHAAALAAGVRGVVFTAAVAGGAGGPVRLGLSYARFSQVSGGGYGLSLGLAELPGCALTSPQRPACRARAKLAWRNDPARQSVSASVTLPGGSGPVVLAVTPMLTDGGGPAGTYQATSLRASGTWAEGGASGSFTYSYPLPVPPAASGLVPSLSLDYDSGTVDGQTSNTQQQASWAGDGWTLSGGDSFIEQSFLPCQDDGGPGGSFDECYNGPVLTLSLDGTSVPLVCDGSFSYASDSTCTAADDQGEVITHHVGAGNGTGTHFTDYWTVTTRDGTTYSFGLNHLPGWASGDQATNSVDSVPVFSPESADPCYHLHGTDFTGSYCTMAYRWNLDYVTDVHANAMAYYYHQDTNAYAQYGTSAAVSYVRDSHLDHIDYGFTDGNAYTGNAPGQVTFTPGDRCFADSCDQIGSNEANWQDVPYDQDYCAAGANSGCAAGTTFWSTVALASITTQQWNGSKYVSADSWALQQAFPKTGDINSPSTLFLTTITHTGADTTAGGGAVTLPPVTFAPVPLANRLDWSNYGVQLVRNRIGNITTETGAVIAITYTQPDQCTSNFLPNPSANKQSCFPVYWQQFTPKTGPDWFVKYAVQSVSESDPTNVSQELYTSYKYSHFSAAWHYDDNELVQTQYRTYGQWRGYQDITTYTGTSGDPQTKTETTYYQGMDGDTLPGGGTRSITLTDSQGGQHPDTNQLAGDVLESTTYNLAGGPVDHSAISSYWVSAPVASRDRSSENLPPLTANATGLVETWTRQAITDTTPTTWRTTETDTSYDNHPDNPTFGLPLFTFRHGDLSDPTQQACTTTTYAKPNTNPAKNLTGLVAETEVDAQPCGGPNPNGASAPTPSQINALTAPVTLSRPADVISDVRTYYDDPPVLSGGVPQPTNPAWPQTTVPTAGDPTVVQQATGYASGAFTYQSTAGTIYDSYGRPVTRYDGNGNETDTSYTMTNGVTTKVTVTNPLGQPTTTTLDPLRGIPLTQTDANNIKTSLQYDGLGRLTGMWDNNRQPSSTLANVAYSYAIPPNPPAGTAPVVVTAKWLDEENIQVTSTTLYDAMLRVRQTQYPAPNGGILINDNFYDTRGWLYKTNTNYFDPNDNPSSTVIAVPDSAAHDQHVTAFDGLGRPVLVIDCNDSSVVSATYTAYYGDRVTTVPPQGGTPTATVTDALGRTTELDQYTSAPNVPALPTACSSTATSVSISGGTTQATTYSYNHRGWLKAITDAATGQQWTKSYNLLGQVTGTTDPDGGTTTLTYDNNGNLQTTTGADQHTISYTYDALNRKTGEYDGPTTSSPLLATWVYDNSNNIPGVTFPNDTATTETSYHSGNPYVVQQQGFNGLGESTGETVAHPAAENALAGSYTLTRTYTPVNGLPYSDAYPGTGTLPAETVTHSYKTAQDLPDNLASIVQYPPGQTTPVAYSQNTSYTDYQQVSQQEIGTVSNNATITSKYDLNTGALTKTTVQNGAGTTTYDTTQYGYDPAGNLTSQTDTRQGGQSETQCFRYNTLDRLTQAWTATDNCAADPSTGTGGTVGDGIPGSAYWTTWKYDTLGNQTSQTDHNPTGGPDTIITYSYNGNGTSQPDTLTSATTTSPSGTTTSAYTYDPAGNTLTRDLPTGNQTLTWTDDGKLATDTTTAGTTHYIYDADGNLLVQKDPGQTTLYLFGGAQQITLNTQTGAITGTRFIPLPGGGQAVRTSGNTSSYSYEFADLHGTGLLTLDNTTQNPTWRQYTPYGAPRGTPPASWPDTNGYLGQPTDPTTALTTLGARQYDPTTGRFLSLDPLLDPTSPGQLNGYTYATDNPTTQSDPTGLHPPGCSGGYPVHCGPYTNPPDNDSTGGGPSCPGWEPGCPGFTGGGATDVPQAILIGTVFFPVTPQALKIQQIYNQSYQALIGDHEAAAGPETMFRALVMACESNPGICGSTLINALTRAGPTGTAMTQADYQAYQKSGQSIMGWMQSHGSQLLMQNSIAVSAAVGGMVPGVLPGYSSFRAAKADLGSPGEGNVFDHVVEQSQISRSDFAPEDIHNPFNLDPVPNEINQLKANYYSSIRPFTGGMTVRDWLTGQSFSDQYEFGMDILGLLQNGEPLP